MNLRPGARVRMNETCPWPERRGCDGVVVTPPRDGMYPQPAPWEVVVKLDDDPLGYNDRWWTCVLGKNNVADITEGT